MIQGEFHVTAREPMSDVYQVYIRVERFFIYFLISTKIGSKIEQTFAIIINKKNNKILNYKMARTNLQKLMAVHVEYGASVGLIPSILDKEFFFREYFFLLFKLFN